MTGVVSAPLLLLRGRGLTRKIVHQLFAATRLAQQRSLQQHATATATAAAATAAAAAAHAHAPGSYGRGVGFASGNSGGIGNYGGNNGNNGNGGGGAGGAGAVSAALAAQRAAATSDVSACLARAHAMMCVCVTLAGDADTAAELAELVRITQQYTAHRVHTGSHTHTYTHIDT